MIRLQTTRRPSAGFTLVELAMVTLIIGIFLTLGLSAMNAVRENTALSATISKQAAIKEALIGYLRRNSRLPCPDSDLAAPDGLENRAGIICTQKFGLLPYVTLGVARDAVQDGWGNFFSYHVSNTVTAGAYTDWINTANFRGASTGVLTVNDRIGGAATSLTSPAGVVVAVIISHGANGFGAYTIGGTRNALPAGADELENAPNPPGVANNTYFRRNTTTDDAAAGGAFDDVVMFLSADDLLNPLFRDGSFKTPAAQNSEIRDALQRIKSALIGYAMATNSANGGSTCTTGGSNPRCKVLPYSDFTPNGNGSMNVGLYTGEVPYVDLGLIQADATDPWGVRYYYAVTTNSVASNGIGMTTPATSSTITIWSSGPDGISGNADDITLTVSVGEIRPYLGTGLP